VDVKGVREIHQWLRPRGSAGGIAEYQKKKSKMRRTQDEEEVSISRSGCGLIEGGNKMFPCGKRKGCRTSKNDGVSPFQAASRDGYCRSCWLDWNGGGTKKGQDLVGVRKKKLT